MSSSQEKRNKESLHPHIIHFGDVCTSETLNLKFVIVDVEDDDHFAGCIIMDINGQEAVGVSSSTLGGADITAVIDRWDANRILSGMRIYMGSADLRKKPYCTIRKNSSQPARVLT